MDSAFQPTLHRETAPDIDASHTMPGARILFENISKIYSTSDGPMLAIDDVTFGVSQGEFVSIVGPSGCGKSTLLMLTSGLLLPTQGRISIDEETISRPYTNIGFMFQQDNLLEWQTVIRNVLLPIEIRGLMGKRDGYYLRRAQALLEKVGLQGFERRYPSELSGGMRQRVALCRALIYETPLLLLDEPFAAVDAITRDQLNVDLQRLWQGSKPTVVFITHNIVEAVFLADRVIVMTPRPGKLRTILPVGLPRPRRLADRADTNFNEVCSTIRGLFEEMQVLREP